MERQRQRRELEDNNLIMRVAYMFSGAYGVYPGATTRPEERPKQHLTALRNGRHPNENFQQAVNQHGLQSFFYVSLEPVIFDKLAQAEQKLYVNPKNQERSSLTSDGHRQTPIRPVTNFPKRTRRKQSCAKKGNKNAAKHFVFISPDGNEARNVLPE